MLVLTRKENELIYIVNDETGDVVTVSINEVRSDRVKVGIQADQKYKIIRAEIYEKYKKGAATKPCIQEPLEVDRAIHFS
jgi:carbon storage regulator CsrA